MSKIVYNKIESTATAFGTQISCLLNDENVVNPILVASEDAEVWSELLLDVVNLRDQLVTIQSENEKLNAEKTMYENRIEKLSNENDALLKDLSRVDMSAKIETFKSGLSVLLDSTFGGDLVGDVSHVVQDVDEFEGVRYVVDDNYLINFARAAKILGYSYKEVCKMLNCDLNVVFKRHAFKWSKLATKDDFFYVRKIQRSPIFDGKFRLSNEFRARGQDLLSSLELPLRKLCGKGLSLNEISRDLGVPVADLWSVCMFKGIDFTLNKKGFTFSDTVWYVPFLSVENIIANAGGLPFLYDEMEKGRNQVDLALSLGISQGSLSEFLTAHK